MVQSKWAGVEAIETALREGYTVSFGDVLVNWAVANLRRAISEHLTLTVTTWELGARPGPVA